MQKELRVLLLANGLILLAGGVFGPIYAVFVENIGGDLLTAGTAYSAFALAAGVLIYFLSKWEDHVKHQEKLVIIGYALNSIGCLGYLLIQRPWHLFVVQVILGLGEAISAPAYDGLYSRHLDKGKFVSEWGLWESMQWIVLAIAAALGGFIADTYGFRHLFVLMFLASFLGMCTAIILVKNKKH